jgi:hypothetical protein
VGPNVSLSLSLCMRASLTLTSPSRTLPRTFPNPSLLKPRRRPPLIYPISHLGSFLWICTCITSVTLLFHRHHASSASRFLVSQISHTPFQLRLSQGQSIGAISRSPQGTGRQDGMRMEGFEWNGLELNRGLGSACCFLQVRSVVMHDQLSYLS